MATTPTPVLSLDTIIPRPTIRIDGKPYQMRSADEFAWLVYRGKAGLFRKAATLMVLPRRTAAQEKEIERMLGPLVQELVLAPAKVLARLSDAQRFQVLEVFSQLLQTARTTTGRAGANAMAGRSSRGRRSSTKTTSASK
jgi:hypothetical protein